VTGAAPGGLELQRVLLVGSGSIAVRHASALRRIRPGLRIARLASADRPASDPRIDGLVIEVLRDPAAAIAFDPQAVIVANATTSHVASALPWASCGLPVLVEKPISDSLEGLAPLIDLAADGPLPVLIGYCLRYHPLYVQVRESVRQGRFGRLVGVRASVGQHLAGWRPGRDVQDTVTAQARLGGGALLELSHDVDLVLDLAGAARSVVCTMDVTGTVAPDIDDLTNVLIGHESGVRSSIHMNLLEVPSHRRLTLLHAEGTIHLDLVEGSAMFCLNGGTAESFRVGEGEVVDLYHDQMVHFLDVAENHAPSAVTVGSAAATLEVCLAARRSAESAAEVLV
jgi:predicted dehydrogenase